MTSSAPRSHETRIATRANRRAALELARIYVASSAHGDALEALAELPENGWDEEAHLLRAEALIGLGRICEADEILGLPILPGGDSTRPFDLWRFLLQLRVLHRQGAYARVIEIGRSYFEAGEGIPSVYLARTAMVVAQSMLVQRAPADARQLYEHVLELYDRLGSKEGQVDALFGIANTHLLDCHWDRADALYEEARFRYEELGITDKALAACINLGILRVKRGELVSGRELLGDALTRAIQLGAVRRTTTIRLGLALAEIRSGRPEDARAFLAQCLRDARGSGAERDLGLALELLGEMYLALGAWSRADRVLQRALRVAERIAPQGDIAFEVRRRLAEVALGRGDTAMARTEAARARSMAQTWGDSYEVATCERVLAVVAERHGRRAEAIRLATSAANLLGRLGETFERGRVTALRSSLERARDLEPGLGARHIRTPKAMVRATRIELGAAVSERTGRQVVDCGGRTTAAETVPGVAAGWAEDASTSGVSDLESTALETRDPALYRSLTVARAVAPLDVPLLVRGEFGCGLEQLARLIHGWSGRQGPYVPFHCAGLAPDRLEAEFTGRLGRSGLDQIASGGTVFLDSVSALGVESQRRLATWIGEQVRRASVARVRVIAALRLQAGVRTSIELARELRTELERVVLDLPPLRERPTDIIPLIEALVVDIGSRHGRRFEPVPASVLALWAERPWPGNFAELRDTVERYLTSRLSAEIGP